MKFDASKIQDEFVNYKLSNLTSENTKWETDPIRDILKWLAETIECPICNGTGVDEEGHHHLSNRLNPSRNVCNYCHFCERTGKVQRVFALMQEEKKVEYLFSIS